MSNRVLSAKKAAGGCPCQADGTEKALLEELQTAVITYLNLYAPELVSADEHLEMRMEISGYGGR